MPVLGMMLAGRFLDVDLDIQRLVDRAAGQPRKEEKADDIGRGQRKVDALDREVGQ